MIDLIASESELERLWNISIGQWSFFTEEEPYWSVLSSPDWRSDRLNADKLVRFYETGKPYLDTFISTCKKHNIIPSGTCLELGSGVGRVTSHLASIFDNIIATDISEKNLSICNSYCKDFNVEYSVLHNYYDIKSLKSYNCFFSVISLQHNPPPVQTYLLDVILEKLESNGIAYFQIITECNLNGDYQFDLQKHLLHHNTSPAPVIEMHVLPENCIEELASDANCKILDIQTNYLGGNKTTSKTYLLKKSIG